MGGAWGQGQGDQRAPKPPICDLTRQVMRICLVYLGVADLPASGGGRLVSMCPMTA